MHRGSHHNSSSGSSISCCLMVSWKATCRTGTTCLHGCEAVRAHAGIARHHAAAPYHHDCQTCAADSPQTRMNWVAAAQVQFKCQPFSWLASVRQPLMRHRWQGTGVPPPQTSTLPSWVQTAAGAAPWLPQWSQKCVIQPPCAKAGQATGPCPVYDHS